MKTGVTWLGHASAIVRFQTASLETIGILIDPLGRRRMPAAGEYNTVLITHSHIDHLNRWTLASLDRDVRLVVPKGAEPIVKNLGFREVVEVEVGQHLDCDGIDVIAVATKHDNGRWRKGDGPICVGYILQNDNIIVHHAGDVDMSTFEVFDEIGKQFSIDATLLPIGGLLPPWYYSKRQHVLDRGVHIDPATALHIAERLGAKSMVPVHWGTVNLRLFHSAKAPKEHLLQAAKERDLGSLVQVLGHAETLVLDDATS